MILLYPNNLINPGNFFLSKPTYNSKTYLFIFLFIYHKFVHRVHEKRKKIK